MLCQQPGQTAPDGREVPALPRSFIDMEKKGRLQACVPYGPLPPTTLIAVLLPWTGMQICFDNCEACTGSHLHWAQGHVCLYTCSPCALIHIMLMPNTNCIVPCSKVTACCCRSHARPLS